MLPESFAFGHHRQFVARLTGATASSSSVHGPYRHTQLALPRRECVSTASVGAATVPRLSLTTLVVDTLEFTGHVTLSHGGGTNVRDE